MTGTDCAIRQGLRFVPRSSGGSERFNVTGHRPSANPRVGAQHLNLIEMQDIAPGDLKSDKSDRPIDADFKRIAIRAPERRIGLVVPDPIPSAPVGGNE